MNFNTISKRVNNMTKYLTTKESAKKLGVSLRRVQAMIKQGHHFPNAIQCPCGQAWLIPEKDLKLLQK